MKKLIPQIFLTLLLIIAASSASFSQTSGSTNAGKTETTVGKNETVSFLIQQNENARTLIAVQEKRISDLENELSVERENSASIGKSYDAAQSEISSLKTSNEALARAVAVNESTIAILKDDNAKQRDKARRANRDKWKAVAALAGVIALKFLIP